MKIDPTRLTYEQKLVRKIDFLWEVVVQDSLLYLQTER